MKSEKIQKLVEKIKNYNKELSLLRDTEYGDRKDTLEEALEILQKKEEGCEEVFDSIFEYLYLRARSSTYTIQSTLKKIFNQITFIMRDKSHPCHEKINQSDMRNKIATRFLYPDFWAKQWGESIFETWASEKQLEDTKSGKNRSQFVRRMPQTHIKTLTDLYKHIEMITCNEIGNSAFWHADHFSTDKDDFNKEQLSEYYQVMYLYLEMVSDFLANFSRNEKYHFSVIKSLLENIDDIKDETIKQNIINSLRKNLVEMYNLINDKHPWTALNNNKIYSDLMKEINNKRILI